MKIYILHDVSGLGNHCSFESDSDTPFASQDDFHWLQRGYEKTDREDELIPALESGATSATGGSLTSVMDGISPISINSVKQDLCPRISVADKSLKAVVGSGFWLDEEGLPKLVKVGEILNIVPSLGGCMYKDNSYPTSYSKLTSQEELIEDKKLFRSRVTEEIDDSADRWPLLSGHWNDDEVWDDTKVPNWPEQKDITE